MIESGPLRGDADDVRYRGEPERRMWCGKAHEERTALRSGRAPMEVGSERGAHVGRKGHALSPASLAVHDELADSPVHVVETQGRHFGGAQAETGQRGDDREVTAAAEGTAVAGGEQSSDVLGLET